MDCFRCGGDMLKKQLDGVLVDACGNCRGIWLDGGELDMLEYGERKDMSELAVECRSETLAERSRLLSTVGMCPKCQKTPLREIIRSGVKVDECAQCGGIFFDYGELDQVMAEEKPGVLRQFLRSVSKLRRG